MNTGSEQNLMRALWFWTGVCVWYQHTMKAHVKHHCINIKLTHWYSKWCVSWITSGHRRHMLKPGVNAIRLSCEWERETTGAYIFLLITMQLLPENTHISAGASPHSPTSIHTLPRCHTAHFSQSSSLSHALSVTSSHSQSLTQSTPHPSSLSFGKDNYRISQLRRLHWQHCWCDLSLDNVWSKCTHCLCSP